MSMQGWPDVAGIAYRSGTLSPVFVVHSLKALETIFGAA